MTGEPGESGPEPNPSGRSSSYGREPLRGAAARLAFGLYKQVLSPVLHTVGVSQCLYRPTCSEYAYVAIARFGALRGGWMALGRVLRCHPWAHGGFDPVPERATPRHSEAADHLRYK